MLHCMDDACASRIDQLVGILSQHNEGSLPNSLLDVIKESVRIAAKTMIGDKPAMSQVYSTNLSTMLDAMIAEEDSADDVLTKTKSNKEDLRIVRNCTNALLTLSAADIDDDDEISDDVLRIIQTDSIKLIVELMRKYVDDADVMHACCGILSNVANHEEIRAKIAN